MRLSTPPATTRYQEIAAGEQELHQHYRCGDYLYRQLWRRAEVVTTPCGAIIAGGRRPDFQRRRDRRVMRPFGTRSTPGRVSRTSGLSHYTSENCCVLRPTRSTGDGWRARTSAARCAGSSWRRALTNRPLHFADSPSGPTQLQRFDGSLHVFLR